MCGVHESIIRSVWLTGCARLSVTHALKKSVHISTARGGGGSQVGFCSAGKGQRMPKTQEVI